MKKPILTLLIAFVAIVAAKAQQIAVVSGNGATTVYQTFDEAIEGAIAGSTVYLPGGSFTVTKAITKKLTIIGIGHKLDGENADGSTSIVGDVVFTGESSGSAVMGCYVTGNVSIGSNDDSQAVNNILVRYCNANSIYVNRGDCTGIIINQNYLRGYPCSFSFANVTITNNILQGVQNINGGTINCNIFMAAGTTGGGKSYGNVTFNYVHNAVISNNVLLTGGTWEPYNMGTQNTGNVYSNNLSRESGSYDIKNNMIFIGSVEWNDVFENYNNGAISPDSKFHFKGDYIQYENQVGIYAGTGFDDSALPPVPHIIAKSIPEQTDAQGKLNIKIRVKAGE